MKKEKFISKRTTLLQKAAYIIRPFVLYMLIKTFAMLFLAIAIPSIPIAGIAVWVEANSNQLSAVINGVASIIAVYFILKDFLIDVNVSGEVDIDKNTFGQMAEFFKKGFFGLNKLIENDKKSKIKKAKELAICAGIGIITSYSLNILINFISKMLQNQKLLGSDKYEVVETIQYSVPLWIGLILYGLVSPIVEEIVFRGITYNRIKRFYGVFKAIIISSLLFGGFHGNLPQFVYGSIMGGIMAVCYEYMGYFAAPVIVHMSANIFTFLFTAIN